MIKIKRSNLKDFFDAVSAKMPLFIPLKNGEQVNYGCYDGVKEFDLDTLKTVKSPKDLFFPQSENMMKFRAEGKKIDIIDIRSEKEPFVLFGVKACDFKAFSVLDNVFLGEPVDTYYKARREAGIIFTLACGKPQESCFCTVFGIDATNPLGDATCWIDKDYLYVTANTEKGEQVLALAKEFTEKSDDKAVEKIKSETKAILEKLPFTHLDISRFKPENLNELFNLPVWNELSEDMLGVRRLHVCLPDLPMFRYKRFQNE